MEEIRPVEKQPKPRPRVYTCIPSYGHCKTEMAFSHFTSMSRACIINPNYSTSSALPRNFNLQWSTALNFQKHDVVDYFLMHHDDIEVRTQHFLDVMIQEMEATGAAVLSVVQAIKTYEVRLTSTGVETDSPWRVKKLSFDDLADLPETFTLPNLLINTGLMLVDIRRPEFHELIGDELFFHFEFKDRIVKGKDGMLHSQFRPEDWEFSRQCHSRGLPVYATTKVECLHWGWHGFSNKVERKCELKTTLPAITAAVNGESVRN